MHLQHRRLRTWVRGLTVSAAALATVGLTAPGTSAQSYSLNTACQDPPPADYDDRDKISSAHRQAVDCLTDRGIVEGYGYDEGTRYLPGGEVNRAQMATFVTGMLTEAGVELPEPSDQGFEDVDDDGTHSDAIRQLAELGIVQGVTEDEYRPAQQVDRAQMASYLSRALAHQAGVEVEDLQAGELPFDDVSTDSVHAPNIRGAHQLGIAFGVDEDTYAPAADVERAPMASFVARTLDTMIAQQTVLDYDQGAFEPTIYTALTEGGRCFYVTAGEAWATNCDPTTTDDALQPYEIDVDDDFTIVAGVVTDEVASVEVEYEGGPAELELVDTRSPNLRAWGTHVLAADIEAIVAYDADGEELDRYEPSA